MSYLPAEGTVNQFIECQALIARAATRRAKQKDLAARRLVGRADSPPKGSEVEQGIEANCETWAAPDLPDT